MAFPKTEGEAMFDSAMKQALKDRRSYSQEECASANADADRLTVPAKCLFCKTEGTARINPYRKKYNHGAGIYGFSCDSYYCVQCGHKW